MDQHLIGAGNFSAVPINRLLVAQILADLKIRDSMRQSGLAAKHLIPQRAIDKSQGIVLWRKRDPCRKPSHFRTQHATTLFLYPVISANGNIGAALHRQCM